MENKSLYDPSRKTVGAIYRDAQLASHDPYVINGDLTNELMKSLVNDLNETIEQGTKDFNGREFYITVHEKKDLQMPRAILRRMIKTLYRPYPEDDTMVYRVFPSANEVRFCWCLPHWSEMDNMLANENLFESDLINEIKAWKRVDLYHFGFTKNSEGNWIASQAWEDKKMTAPPKKSLVLTL